MVKLFYKRVLPYWCGTIAVTLQMALRALMELRYIPLQYCTAVVEVATVAVLLHTHILALLCPPPVLGVFYYITARRISYQETAVYSVRHKSDT